jgi:hypothetical protein
MRKAGIASLPFTRSSRITTTSAPRIGAQETKKILYSEPKSDSVCYEIGLLIYANGTFTKKEKWEQAIHSLH